MSDRRTYRWHVAIESTFRNRTNEQLISIYKMHVKMLKSNIENTARRSLKAARVPRGKGKLRFTEVQFLSIEGFQFRSASQKPKTALPHEAQS